MIAKRISLQTSDNTKQECVHEDHLEREHLTKEESFRGLIQVLSYMSMICFDLKQYQLDNEDRNRIIQLTPK